MTAMSSTLNFLSHTDESCKDETHFCGYKCKNHTYNFVQAIDGYSYEAGKSWKADSGTLYGSVYDITVASNSNADLHVFLCKDPQFYGIFI